MAVYKYELEPPPGPSGVLVDLELGNVGELGVRVGSQASVTVYTGTHPLLNPLGRLRMRIASYLTYAY